MKLQYFLQGKNASTIGKLQQNSVSDYFHNNWQLLRHFPPKKNNNGSIIDLQYKTTLLASSVCARSLICIRSVNRVSGAMAQRADGEGDYSFALKFWLCFVIGMVILLSLFRGFSSAVENAPRPPSAHKASKKKQRSTQTPPSSSNNKENSQEKRD